MSDLVRLSISLEKELLNKLDLIVGRCNSGNRSEFIRDLVRNKLAEEAVNMDQIVLATVTILYKDHMTGIEETLKQTFSNRPLSVVGSSIVPIDKTSQARMVMMVGKASHIQSAVDCLSTEKSIIQASANYCGLDSSSKF